MTTRGLLADHLAGRSSIYGVGPAHRDQDYIHRPHGLDYLRLGHGPGHPGGPGAARPPPGQRRKMIDWDFRAYLEESARRARLEAQQKIAKEWQAQLHDREVIHDSVWRDNP